MQAILEDLTDSRQAQQAAKITQQASMALHEKEDFERILKVTREKEAADATLAAQVRQCVHVSKPSRARCCVMYQSGNYIIACGSTRSFQLVGVLARTSLGAHGVPNNA